MLSARHQRLGQSQAEGHLTRRSALRLLCVWACTVFAGLTVCLPPLPAATLVHSPYLQNLREDRVTIMWSARENIASTVRYSKDNSFSLVAVAGVPRVFQPSETGMSFTFYQYQAELNGLAPGTAYSYRVYMGADNVPPGGEYVFHTAGPGPYSFLVFGDSGAGTPGQRDVLAQMLKEPPSFNFVVHVGDIAYERGTFDEFTANHFGYYFTLMRRACFFPVPGNHEYYTNSAAPFLALHAPPSETVPDNDRGRYYSYDWGNTHFVALDANLLDAGYALPRARMLAWLDNDLAKSQADWRIAYFHQTPYPISQHLTDPIDIAAREQFVPILERHGVQLVLAGHEHNYQRTKTRRAGVPVPAGMGTVYMTSGGGGGGLHPAGMLGYSFLERAESIYHYLRVEVDASQIVIHAIDKDGKEFDRAVLTLGSPRPPPVLTPGDSVLNGASFTSSLASGELVSIFGENLAAGVSQAAGYPWPNVLSGSFVTLNGVPMPLTYASPRQINAQLPTGARGAATLRVTTPTGYAETQVTISATAPAIFEGGILHANYAPVTNAVPAHAGETLVVFMTGLGQVDGDLASGQAAPAFPLLRVLAPVQVDMGSVPVTPDFAGLSPGLAGVNQVNLVVPLTLPTGVYPLRVSAPAKGNFSNTQSIQVMGRNP
jgi:acid phosphatase type 7